MTITITVFILQNLRTGEIFSYSPSIQQAWNAEVNGDLILNGHKIIKILDVEVQRENKNAE